MYISSRKKILFIAIANSSHTISWIDLLNNSNIDIRVYGVGLSYSSDFKYCYSYKNSRRRIIGKIFKLIRKILKLNILDDIEYEKEYLYSIVIKYKPDIIHTLGFEPAGYIFLEIVDRCRNKLKFKWIHTSRGGPEFTLKKLINSKPMEFLLSKCDYFIADNKKNYEYAFQLGLKKEKAYSEIIPGTGGVDTNLYIRRKLPASLSRVILYPKAYECPASKALPVFEAIKNSWDYINPCQIIMTAMIPETKLWYYTLSEEIRNSCIILDRIPREKIFEYLLKARVVLLPSLTDGIPNLLYEAMATGVLPIASPLETLIDIFEENKNVLYARNLYPNEIAEALVIAMDDNSLVDSIVSNNIKLVKKIADRKKIRKKVIHFYNTINR